MAQIVHRLFKLLPPQDVGDPKEFLVAASALFAGYPLDLAEAAAFEIAQRSDRPTLKLMREVLDEFVEKAMARQSRADRAKQLLPPVFGVRTREQQERIDRMVADTRRAFGLPPEGLPRSSKTLQKGG